MKLINENKVVNGGVIIVLKVHGLEISGLELLTSATG